MHKLLRSSPMAGVVTAAAIGLTAVPAHAAGYHYLWIVDPNDSFSAVSTDSKFTRETYEFSCAETRIEGDFFDGYGGYSVGEVITSQWVSCMAPYNLPFTVTHYGEWFFTPEDQPGGTGTPVRGRLDYLVLRISGPLCTAEIIGTARATYDNNGTLTINETGSGLTVQSGASCLRMLNGGDHPRFTATFAVSADSGSNPITINRYP